MESPSLFLFLALTNQVQVHHDIPGPTLPGPRLRPQEPPTRSDAPAVCVDAARQDYRTAGRGRSMDESGRSFLASAGYASLASPLCSILGYLRSCHMNQDSRVSVMIFKHNAVQDRTRGIGNEPRRTQTPVPIWKAPATRKTSQLPVPA